MKTERIPASQARALLQKPKKAKYRNKPVVEDGIRFDSMKERDRYLHLRALQKAGAISHLELQPVFKFEFGGRKVVSKSKRYPNGRQLFFKADFAYFDGQHRVVEDVKGFRTKEFIIKKAFVEALFPAVRIVEI